MRFENLASLCTNLMRRLRNSAAVIWIATFIPQSDRELSESGAQFLSAPLSGERYSLTRFAESHSTWILLYRVGIIGWNG